VAWGYGGLIPMGASGGGVSTTFDRPDYQNDANVPQVNGKNGRGVPDISGNASPATGYDVLVDGKEQSIGGTSAVAPLMAALAARLGQGVGHDIGFLNPTFYKNTGDFNDITKGNNGGYQAGPGWDAVTGLGVPDGEKLLATLKAAHAAQA
jgi:kumamolisin